MRVDATHAEENMPSGLVRRQGRYVLRRRVPLDLVEALGRKEITKALGTADRTEAKKRHALEWVRLDQEFDAARAALRAKDLGSEAQNLSEQATRRAARNGGGFPQIFAAMSAVLDASFPEAGTEPASPVVQRNHSNPESRRSAKDVTWDRVVSRWAKERKPNVKTRKAHEAVVDQFRSIVGDIPVRTTTKSHILLFKEKLVETGISPSNLRTKLSRFKTVANYAFENDLIGSKVTEGVRAPKSKGKARVPFDDSALTKLFSGPVHKGGERPVQGRGEASYWLPLIALFTGARLEEIAGLLAVDLIELGYQDEAGADQSERLRMLKNDESERTVPVHPELIRLGLLRYARSVEAEGEALLFPRLTAHASGKRAHKWGQWFGDYLRNSCGVSDKRTVFHSFRHSLKDAGRESGVPEELQRAIMGHSQEGVAGSYGVGFSRRRIVEAMGQIRIPGLPPLDPQH
jgi:integrase